MSKHTPGPLSPGKLETAAITLGQDGRGLILYRLTSSTGRRDAEGDAEFEADVRLYCAAPDLLAALESALNTNRVACDLAERLGVQGPTRATWLPAAHAAIAKAKGTP